MFIEIRTSLSTVGYNQSDRNLYRTSEAVCIQFVLSPERNWLFVLRELHGTLYTTRYVF